jgi:hypothetical protein
LSQLQETSDKCKLFSCSRQSSLLWRVYSFGPIDWYLERTMNSCCLQNILFFSLVVCNRGFCSFQNAKVVYDQFRFDIDIKRSRFFYYCWQYELEMKKILELLLDLYNTWSRTLFIDFFLS